MFQRNVLFHRALFGLCGITCLIETIESLAQKVSGIRSYAHATPEALNDARRDHIAMIKALRTGQSSVVVANSVTWYESGGNIFVQADVNGNTTADLTLKLTGINLNLTASDFWL